MTTAILPAPAIAWARSARLAAAARVVGAVAAGGLLLGISTPLSIRWTLGPLAWFWLVPLLLALGRSTPAWRWFLAAWASCTITGLISTWGVGHAVGAHWAPVYFAYAGLTLAVPFVPFLLVRRLAGWQAALWSIPFVWPLTEWGLRHVQGTLTWLTIAVTQANSIWTNQFADLFGEWGLTAWVMLFNVLVYRAWTAGGVRRILKPAAAMLIPALAYSGFAISAEHRRQTAAPASLRLNVLLVQPDVQLHQQSPNYMKRAIESAANLTDAAVTQSKPDLIVWPEEAVPLTLRTNPMARFFITQAVADWGTPLLTGTFDRTRIGGPRMLVPRNSNAAVLLTPGPPGSGRQAVRFGSAHAKGRLMPFVEAPPYANLLKRVKAVRTLKVRDGAGMRLQPGSDRQVIRWRADQGWTYAAAAPICFEELFDADFADYARRGAQFFAVLSDDSAFGRAASGHTLAAIGRMRAIETRRPVARATVTGLTTAFDAAGRELATAPWWQPATARAELVLNDRSSFYSGHPGAFPALCGCGLLPLLVVFGRKNRRRV